MSSTATFSVPGFGCTYVAEFEDLAGQRPFSLRFLKQGESESFSPCGPTLLFLLEAGRADVALGSMRFPLESAQWMLIPPGSQVRIISRSFVLKRVRLGFPEEAIQTCAVEYDLEQPLLRADLSHLAIRTRTIWIQELCHRYVFERVIAQAPASQASRFCEIELLKELHYQCRDEAAGSTSPSARHASLSPALQMALSHIETHLHEPLTLSNLCAAAALSESALVRLFRKELETTPIRYVWRRRLQEAQMLLGTGRYRVSEVAGHVGFADVSSFSQAFSREFGRNPSTVRVSD